MKTRLLMRTTTRLMEWWHRCRCGARITDGECSKHFTTRAATTRISPRIFSLRQGWKNGSEKWEEERTKKRPRKRESDAVVFVRSSLPEESLLTPTPIS